ncbi:MAG: pyrroline-5-carboxylate reductase [Actinomycetota bacterium]|jgi:pyrroline-5-carboxylate reductase
MEGNLAVLGAGKMGEALLSGLLRSGWRRPDQIIATDRYPERLEELRSRYGVQTTLSNAEAASRASVLLLAVKPQDMAELCDEIAPAIKPDVHLVISVAAGIRSAFIERRLPAGVPVVRCMSNTAVLVDEAMTVVSAGRHADNAHLVIAEEIWGHVGSVIRLPEEHQDSVTALSGSGPAYFFLLVEAMIDAGIMLGLPRAVSTQLIVQTMSGAAKMLRETGKHPVELREMVTSPGGTTIAAIRELENHRVRAAFLDAIDAARIRSRELASGHE